MTELERNRGDVIGAPIDVLTWDQTVDRISMWSRSHDSRVVCICNAHSVVTARQDRDFAKIVREADMATPDGAPVAWMLRRLGESGQERINGPDLMIRYCAHAEQMGEAIYLYGGEQASLMALVKNLGVRFPGLIIAGHYSPPFRPLTREEDEAIVAEINQCGAGVVWVGLGCPKQERWMAEHRGRVNAVMVGVGAAFDYHAGKIKRAPEWMQNNGLEWMYRFGTEPKRLWKRYVATNTLFIWYAFVQLSARVFGR